MILSEMLLVPVDWITDVAEKAQDMLAFYVGICAGDALTLYIFGDSMQNTLDMNGGGSYGKRNTSRLRKGS